MFYVSRSSHLVPASRKSKTTFFHDHRRAPFSLGFGAIKRAAFFSPSHTHTNKPTHRFSMSSRRRRRGGGRTRGGGGGGRGDGGRGPFDGFAPGSSLNVSSGTAYFASQDRMGRMSTCARMPPAPILIPSHFSFPIISLSDPF
jgi:hypothetical protein